MTRQDLRRQGEAMPRTLFGSATRSAGLGNLVIEVAFGGRSRPGLEPRALVAIASFTALHLTEQVAKFGQSALNFGLTKTEVLEAIIQTAPLTGFPPALNALGAISAAFAP